LFIWPQQNLLWYCFKENSFRGFETTCVRNVFTTEFLSIEFLSSSNPFYLSCLHVVQAAPNASLVKLTIFFDREWRRAHPMLLIQTGFWNCYWWHGLYCSWTWGTSNWQHQEWHLCVWSVAFGAINWKETFWWVDFVPPASIKFLHGLLISFSVSNTAQDQERSNLWWNGLRLGCMTMRVWFRWLTRASKEHSPPRLYLGLQTLSCSAFRYWHKHI
jgi:hypothetical protein